MELVLKKVNKDNISTLKNLYQLYQYDFTEMTFDDVNVHGIYEEEFELETYIQDEDKEAYIFFADEKIAGFAMLKKYPYIINEEVKCIAEFFVLRKYRRKGIGTEATKQIFEKYPGRMIMEVRKSNVKAEAFWNKAIETCGVKVHEIKDDRYNNVDWNIHDIKI